MFGRSGFRLLLALVLIVGVALLGAGAYQAGLAQGTAQAVQSSGSGAAGAPVVVPYYGWHPFGFGFGLFGFLGTLLFVFLIFAVIRALAFGGRGRGWGGRGWGGPRGFGPGAYGRGPGGPGGEHGWRGGPWEDHARETFDEWHRRSHEGNAAGGPAAGPTEPAPRAGA